MSLHTSINIQSASSGFAGIYRSPLKEFSGADRSVLLCILTQCNFEDNADYVLSTGEEFPLQRGQLITSLKALEKATGLTTPRVRTALDRLSKRKVITSESSNGLANRGRLITLLKPNAYLHKSDNVTKQDAKRSQSKNKAVTTNKNEKNLRNKENTFGIEKNTKKEPDSMFRIFRVDDREMNGEMLFTEFWDSYPDYGGDGRYAIKFKGTKGQAKKRFVAVINDQKEEYNYGIIIEQAKAYGRSCIKDDIRVRHAATWLYNKCWEDDYSDGTTVMQSKASRGGQGMSTFTQAAMELAAESLQR